MTRCGCNVTNATTCGAIMECIGANLGRGLEYTGGNVQVRFSTDPDNISTIGTDQGLYTPGTGIGPGEQAWLATVATLPEQAISANGGGNYVGPSTQPQLVEYTIANGIDMYTTTVMAGTDGTAVEVITTSMGQSVTVYTDNPGPLSWNAASSLNMTSLNYDAGTRVNPTGDNSDAPTANLTPYGGWGGFYAQQYPGRTVASMLRRVRGRMVVNLFIPRLDLTEEQILKSVEATIQAVVDAGAQDWCIIQPAGYLDDDSRAPLGDWIPLIQAAGITAGANLGQGTTLTDPWTPAEVLATGATWVTVIRDDGRTSSVDDTYVTDMVAAGFEVMATTTGRHYWTTHNFGLGVRAINSPDAVYSRGPRGEANDLDYRLTQIPGLETRTKATGANTVVSDASTAMWDGGFVRTDLPGFWFPPRYGWVDGVSRFANSQLLGTICPIPDTTNFELTMRVQRHSGTTVSNGRWAGFFWGAVDDRDISNTPGGPSNPLRDGYGCIVREPTGAGTRQGIYRYDNGVEVALSTTTGGPGWAANAWTTLIVTVTGAGINFQAVGTSTSATLSTSSATYRGPYVFYSWNDAGTGSATQYHGYDNGTGLVMYEAQS